MIIRLLITGDYKNCSATKVADPTHLDRLLVVAKEEPVVHSETDDTGKCRREVLEAKFRLLERMLSSRGFAALKRFQFHTKDQLGQGNFRISTYGYKTNVKKTDLHLTGTGI